MKLVYRFLFSLHIFVGIGAIAGGAAAILNPLDPLGASVFSSCFILYYWINSG